jgi:hypothetical protein
MIFLLPPIAIAKLAGLSSKSDIVCVCVCVCVCIVTMFDYVKYFLLNLINFAEFNSLYTKALGV